LLDEFKVSSIRGDYAKAHSVPVDATNYVAKPSNRHLKIFNSLAVCHVLVLCIQPLIFAEAALSLVEAFPNL
jgi:hypothetical protein